MAEVDFGSTDVGRPKRFVARQGSTSRLCILDQAAQHEHVHYLAQEDFPDNGGYYICTMPSLKVCKFCGLSGRSGNASDRFGVRIVQYQTFDDGTVPSPIRFNITWWSFGIDKFEQLRLFKQQAGDLRQRDILAQCTNTDYQKMNLFLAGEPVALWISDPVLKEAVSAVYKEKAVSLDVGKLLGRRLSIEEQEKILFAPKQHQMAGSLSKNGLAGVMNQGGAPSYAKDAFGSAQPQMASGSLDSLLGGSPAAQPLGQDSLSSAKTIVSNPSLSSVHAITGVPPASSASSQPAGGEVDFDKLFAELAVKATEIPKG